MTRSVRTSGETLRGFLKRAGLVDHDVTSIMTRTVTEKPARVKGNTLCRYEKVERIDYRGRTDYRKPIVQTYTDCLAAVSDRWDLRKTYSASAASGGRSLGVLGAWWQIVTKKAGRQPKRGDARDLLLLRLPALEGIGRGTTRWSLMQRVPCIRGARPKRAACERQPMLLRGGKGGGRRGAGGKEIEEAGKGAPVDMIELGVVRTRGAEEGHKRVYTGTEEKEEKGNARCQAFGEIPGRLNSCNLAAGVEPSLVSKHEALAVYEKEPTRPTRLRNPRKVSPDVRTLRVMIDVTSWSPRRAGIDTATKTFGN
ncbi:hypothetical protein FB451DRAFT_1193925 [Mycena latifolia]|nr:hypothetical protein FB451DRAFT_1193925 [Mycena latifolia]